MTSLDDLIFDLEYKIEYALDLAVGIPIAEFKLYKARLAEIKQRARQAGTNGLESETRLLSDKVDGYFSEFFSNITPRQIIALSQTYQRPKMLDYIKVCFESFTEIGGKESNNPDPAIVWGIAVLEGRDVLVLGHEKGHLGESYRNGGSAKPIGNEIAMRAMKKAEESNIPIITFVDTPGAVPLEEYPGAAQTIARNLCQQRIIAVPHLSVVIGEGGSGGALAIDAGDRRIMTSKSYYSVISIEGAAAIFFKEKLLKGEEVTLEEEEWIARNLKITAGDAFKAGIVDEVIEEPLEGARIVEDPRKGTRRYYPEFFDEFRRSLVRNLDAICLSVRFGSEVSEKMKSSDERWKLASWQKKNLVEKRYQRYRRIGEYDGRGRFRSHVEDMWHFVQEKGTPYYKRLIHASSPTIDTAVGYLDSVATMLGLSAPEKQESRVKRMIRAARTGQKPGEEELVKKWISCPNSEISDCPDIPALQLYGKYDGVCPNCNYHYKIPIERYIGLITDDGSFREFNEFIESINPLGFEGFDKKLSQAKKTTGKKSALATGRAKIDGQDVIMVLMDFNFRAGTLGSAEGEKYVRAVERAMRERIPVVGVYQSGGVRIEEGTMGLMQMVKTAFATDSLAKKGIPYIAVHADPCMAGSLASFISPAKFTIGELNAQIGFAGLEVIKKTTKDEIPKDYQYAEQVQGRGGLNIISHRRNLRDEIIKLLGHSRHTGYEFI